MQPFLEHKIYQLDYSRALDEYRMLEHFLPKVSLRDRPPWTKPAHTARTHPQETQNRTAATRQNKAMPVGTGACGTGA